MDIIPGILTDKEFKYFKESTYAALAAVSADILSNALNAYIDSPEADSDVVESLQEYMGSLLERYRLNKRVLDEDTISYIDSLVPETMASQDVDYTQIVEKLQFLEDSYTNLVISVAPRNRRLFDNFLKEILDVLICMHNKGVSPAYPDIMDRIKGNQFLFYSPNEKTRVTKVSRVVSARRRWTLTLNGAKYLLYCQEHGIGLQERRRF